MTLVLLNGETYQLSSVQFIIYSDALSPLPPPPPPDAEDLYQSPSSLPMPAPPEDMYQTPPPPMDEPPWAPKNYIEKGLLEKKNKQYFSLIFMVFGAMSERKNNNPDCFHICLCYLTLSLPRGPHR